MSRRIARSEVTEEGGRASPTSLRRYAPLLLVGVVWVPAFASGWPLATRAQGFLLLVAGLACSVLLAALATGDRASATALLAAAAWGFLPAYVASLRSPDNGGVVLLLAVPAMGCLAIVARVKRTNLSPIVVASLPVATAMGALAWLWTTVRYPSLAGSGAYPAADLPFFEAMLAAVSTILGVGTVLAGAVSDAVRARHIRRETPSASTEESAVAELKDHRAVQEAYELRQAATGRRSFPWAWKIIAFRWLWLGVMVLPSVVFGRPWAYALTFCLWLVWWGLVLYVFRPPASTALLPLAWVLLILLALLFARWDGGPAWTPLLPVLLAWALYYFGVVRPRRSHAP